MPQYSLYEIFCTTWNGVRMSKESPWNDQGVTIE